MEASDLSRLVAAAVAELPEEQREVIVLKEYQELTFTQVAEILELIGVERVGLPGSTVALAMLNDAVKKGGAMATSRAGGLSGYSETLWFKR